MLLSFYGSDVVKVRAKALQKLSEYRDGGAEVVAIPSERESNEMVRDALGAVSLFGSSRVYLLDTPSENKEWFEELLGIIPELKKSENTFVLIEGHCAAGDEKKLATGSTEAQKYSAPEKKEFNVFALSDALLARDKKTLWIFLQDAWRQGRTSEEIIGTLFWQIKILRLAEVAKSADEAGQKSFVFDKAKRALKNFTKGEVVKLSETLVALYHDGHSGKRNIDHALEAWVLTL
jgi:DNA polymerase III delta subunit